MIGYKMDINQLLDKYILTLFDIAFARPLDSSINKYRR